MKDFIGFRFGNVHTKDLNLVVVTSSDRYEKNLLPNPKDYTVEIPGGDGQYYFGQTFDSREFNCDVAFDSVDEATWRKISQLFATDKLQDLVFDELPYKTYRAKLKSKPEFKFICFTDRNTGERVYKGEGTLNFICYFPYAFGFNKYIVRAADYYLKTPPETIIKTHTKAENPYANNLIEVKNKHTKEFYNVKNNMNTPWKGGYPTIEQVQMGELFFKTPFGEKSIIDVRGYWDNVPEWAPSSKLLTTPTLDYDQELIFLPQYTRDQYINMDIGIKNNALIGSRILVYNPGDIPIDFTLKLDNKKRTFNNGRGNHFQIRRFNVQRMPISCAVDWTGLTTYLGKDSEEGIKENQQFKYGNRYFRLLKTNTQNIEQTFKKPYYELLNEKHPNHCYLVEPIPKEDLGNFIRIFYQQSEKVQNAKKQVFNKISFEDGLRKANRYEELYELCTTDFEKQELYWKTLKEVIFHSYFNLDLFQEKQCFDGIRIADSGTIYVSGHKVKYTNGFFDNSCLETVIFTDRNDNQKKFELKITDDKVYLVETEKEGFSNEELYLRDFETSLYYRLYAENGELFIESISYSENTLTENFENFVYNWIYNPPEFIRKRSSAKYGEINFNIETYPDWYTKDFLEITTDNMKKTELIIDSEKQMLYGSFLQEMTNVFNGIKEKKEIYNDNIVQGKWFKIPPGWSLIDISPVCEEDNWGGKTWNDARAFNWGYGGDKEGEKTYLQKTFDETYDTVKNIYLKKLGYTEEIIDLNGDDLINFRKKYLERIETAKEKNNMFVYEYYKNKEMQLEYGFLKHLQLYWSLQKNELFDISGNIDEWWWYACNYIWALFPPLYWGYADLLKDAKIEYTPLFY